MIFALWWNLAIRILQPLWQLCGFPTGSLFSITMSPELWDSSVSLFINLAYSWHGLGEILGPCHCFGWVKNHAKPRGYLEKSGNKTLRWKYVQNRWANHNNEKPLKLTWHKEENNQRQRKTMKHHKTILKSMETSKKPRSYVKRPWEP